MDLVKDRPETHFPTGRSCTMGDASPSVRQCAQQVVSVYLYQLLTNRCNEAWEYRSRIVVVLSISLIFARH